MDFAIIVSPMDMIATDQNNQLAEMLEGFDCPAILVSVQYEILATNQHYQKAFGKLQSNTTQHCYKVSHGYEVPCDQAGEDCPLGAAKRSGHKERVLHIHQTPRGKEHVDVEMLPIHNQSGELLYFVELLHPVPLASGKLSDQELVGESPSFQKMLSKVARVAKTDAAVLLLGESGTGKELAARAIHMASSRKDNALVTLECSGLSDSLFESELFGHIKGAFTGALSNKTGLVELADKGTLFLDELGDIPLPMQVKLLRLLETGTFRRVGSSEVRRSDFRLVCATHKKLIAMVEEGSFRSDLYYRINVFPIHLPSLAQRASDIPLLAKSLLRRLSNSTNDYQLSQCAIETLSRYNYRGNIRELRNLMHRAIVVSDTKIIDADVINHCFEDDELSTDSSAVSWPDLKSHEQFYIEKVLAANNNDKVKAAKVLGISTRSLYRKLQE